MLDAAALRARACDAASISIATARWGCSRRFARRGGTILTSAESHVPVTAVLVRVQESCFTAEKGKTAGSGVARLLLI